MGSSASSRHRPATGVSIFRQRNRRLLQRVDLQRPLVKKNIHIRGSIHVVTHHQPVPRDHDPIIQMKPVSVLLSPSPQAQSRASDEIPHVRFHPPDPSSQPDPSSPPRRNRTSGIRCSTNSHQQVEQNPQSTVTLGMSTHLAPKLVLERRAEGPRSPRVSHSKKGRSDLGLLPEDLIEHVPRPRRRKLPLPPGPNSDFSKHVTRSDPKQRDPPLFLTRPLQTLPTIRIRILGIIHPSRFGTDQVPSKRNRRDPPLGLGIPRRSLPAAQGGSGKSSSEVRANSRAERAS